MIADVSFNIAYNCSTEDFSNYSNLIMIDFNDSETLTRPADFKQASDLLFIEMQNHTYKSYGTYYAKIMIANNISMVKKDLPIIIEQCISDFQIGLTTERYF